MCRVRRYRGSWPDPRRVTSVSATSASVGKTTDVLGRAVGEDRRADAHTRQPSRFAPTGGRFAEDRRSSPRFGPVRASSDPARRGAEPARGCGDRGVRARACAPPRPRVPAVQPGSSSQPGRSPAGASSGASGPPHEPQGPGVMGTGRPLGTNHFTPHALHTSRRSTQAGSCEPVLWTSVVRRSSGPWRVPVVSAGPRG